MQGEVALAATNTEIASRTRPDARDAKAATRGPFQAPRQPIGAKADAVVAVLNRQAETRRGRQHRAGASRCCASGDRGRAGQRQEATPVHGRLSRRRWSKPVPAPHQSRGRSRSQEPRGATLACPSNRQASASARWQFGRKGWWALKACCRCQAGPANTRVQARPKRAGQGPWQSTAIACAPPMAKAPPNWRAKASPSAAPLASSLPLASLILHCGGAPGPSLAGSVLARSKAMKKLGSCTI